MNNKSLAKSVKSANKTWAHILDDEVIQKSKLLQIRFTNNFLLICIFSDAILPQLTYLILFQYKH